MSEIQAQVTIEPEPTEIVFVGWLTLYRNTGWQMNGYLTVEIESRADRIVKPTPIAGGSEVIPVRIAIPIPSQSQERTNGGRA